MNDILQTMLETTKNLERFADFNPGRLAEYEVQGLSLIQRDRQKAIGLLASLHAEQFKLSPATAHQTAALFVASIEKEYPQPLKDLNLWMHEIISSQSGLGYPPELVSALDMQVLEMKLNQQTTLENMTELFARKFGLIYNLDSQKIVPAAWIRMMSFERLFNSMKLEGVNKEVEIELWKTGMLGYYTLLQQALH